MHKRLLEVNDSNPSLGCCKYTSDLMTVQPLFSHEGVHHSFILILSYTLNLPRGVIFLFLSDGGLPVVNAFLHFFLIPKCLNFTLILEGYFPWVEDLAFFSW